MLLDADTLEPLDGPARGLRSWRWQTQDLVYSHDGRVLAAAMSRVEGTAATTARTSSWAVAWRSEDPRRPVRRIPLPDGELRQPCPQPRRASPVHVPAAHPTRPRRPGTSVPMGVRPGVCQLAMSPDGTCSPVPPTPASCCSTPGPARSRRELSTGSNARGCCLLLRRRPHARHVSAGDQEALVWDVATGELRARLPLAERVERAAFSPDGSTLYTAGDDATLRQWDLGGSRRFLAQVAPRPRSAGDEDVSIAPGGRPRRLPVGQRGRVPRCPSREARAGARATAWVHRGLGRLGSPRQPVCPADRRPGHRLGHPRRRGRQSGATREAAT